MVGEIHALVTLCFTFSVAIVPTLLVGFFYPSHHHEDNYVAICFPISLLATLRTVPYDLRAETQYDISDVSNVQ